MELKDNLRRKSIFLYYQKLILNGIERDGEVHRYVILLQNG